MIFLVVSFTINAFGQTDYYVTSADQTKLFVQEFGSGKPVIILSGGPGLNPIYLKPAWENLSTNYRCIILNQRGTGRSVLEKVDSATLSMQNYVLDLEALREELKLEK